MRTFLTRGALLFHHPAWTQHSQDLLSSASGHWLHHACLLQNKNTPGPLSLQFGSYFLPCTHAQVPESCLLSRSAGVGQSRPLAPLFSVSDPRGQTRSGCGLCLENGRRAHARLSVVPRDPQTTSFKPGEAYPITERKFLEHHHAMDKTVTYRNRWKLRSPLRIQRERQESRREKKEDQERNSNSPTGNQKDGDREVRGFS